VVVGPDPENQIGDLDVLFWVGRIVHHAHRRDGLKTEEGKSDAQCAFRRVLCPRALCIHPCCVEESIPSFAWVETLCEGSDAVADCVNPFPATWIQIFSWEPCLV